MTAVGLLLVLQSEIGEIGAALLTFSHAEAEGFCGLTASSDARYQARRQRARYF